MTVLSVGAGQTVHCARAATYECSCPSCRSSQSRLGSLLNDNAEHVVLMRASNRDRTTNSCECSGPRLRCNVCAILRQLCKRWSAKLACKAILGQVFNAFLSPGIYITDRSYKQSLRAARRRSAGITPGLPACPHSRTGDDQVQRHWTPLASLQRMSTHSR